MSGSSFDRECTNQCKSAIHGDIITEAISKRSVSDTDLCSFLNYVCCRCESVHDSCGRTALHVAASCGRLDLVRWLVNNRHADVNAKDRESGYTPLHRSIFYGKLNVAVELMKLGANVSETDLDYLTSLEHAMKDGLKPEAGPGGELYSWGSNNNNLLGPQQSKQSPDLLDAFHKEYQGEYVKEIHISQFHSAIITVSGKALACGHGQGGRLGLRDEKSAISPQPISFGGSLKGETITCVQASISRDHSMFLCSDGNIYTCGLNTYQVLGQTPPPEKSLSPKSIKQISKEITGICASQYHSVAWGPNALFTWGLSAGQLGIKLNEKIKIPFISSPKNIRIEMLAANAVLKDVASSNGAIAVCTSDGDIYVLHEYLCRKIASRQLNIEKISIIGGNLDSSVLDREISKEINSELKVAALTNTGNVALWQGSDQKLCRCIYSINRAIIMKQISMNLNELLLVSENGETFKGFIKPRKKKMTSSVEKPNKNTKKSAFHVFLEREECIVVSLQKVPKIHRALSITSDLKGRDFCVIQAPPYRNYVFPEMKKSEIKQNFELLFHETDEHDNIHDVVFKVNGRTFPAHKYILASASPYLEKLIENQEIVILNSINCEIFKQFLSYIYTRECDLTGCGELKNEALKKLCCTSEKENQEIFEEDFIGTVDNISAFEYYKKKSKNKEENNKTKKSKNPVRLLHELAKKFECSSLQAILTNLEMEKFVIYWKNRDTISRTPDLTFDRLNFTHFYDVAVKCRDNKRISAHKCILAARLEYFNNMFMRWNGENISEVTLPFPETTAEALLEYLYTDSLSKLNSLEVDHLFNILVLADQLFVTRLKQECELLLSDLLTLKNVVHILSFAFVYNASNLKYCCMNFIMTNITPLLESRALNELDDELLRELTEFYCKEKRAIECRVITPYSTAVSDEIIESVASAYPVSLTEQIDLLPTKTAQKKKYKQHRNAEKNNSISENDVNFNDIIQFPDDPEIREPVLKNSDGMVNLPSRIRSINLASQVVKNEIVQEQYVAVNSSSLSVSFDDSSAFSELASPPFSSNNKFSLHKNETRSKIVKISQKQRKRMSSESKVVECSSPAIVSPKNPWKVIPETYSPVLQTEPKHINDIICDEKKQKENLVKLTTRPLFYTQIEDKAIHELHKFYNTNTAEDELFVIERVNIGAVAAPIWVPRQK